jgi:Flp pilus assembly pilin Flp
MWQINDKKQIRQVKRRVLGVAAVEFALLITLLLIIVAGIVEFGRAFWYYDALTKATRDGARFLSNVPVVNIPSLASGTEPADCHGEYIPAADTLVYCAAKEANVPSFSINNVDVLCDDVKCEVGMDPPVYITVKIINYQIVIGELIPFITSMGVANWTANLTPETTMRHMKN